jgi:hypothetical protein
VGNDDIQNVKVQPLQQGEKCWIGLVDVNVGVNGIQLLKHT